MSDTPESKSTLPETNVNIGSETMPSDSNKFDAKNWRGTNRSKEKVGGDPWARRIMFTTATLVAIITIAFISIAPLTTWQTTCVTLAIDNYQAGLQPIAYRDLDISGIQKVLSGRCSPATGRGVVRLSNYETSDAIRDQLIGKIQDFKLRQKDVLLAYVRAQSFISSTAEEGSPTRNHCQLAAADFSLEGGSPSGLVRCSHVLDSLGAGSNNTTLIAMDLGNISWDPRLGTLGNFVPSKLDTELAALSNGKKHLAVGDSWLITSNDSLEFSHVSLSDNRSLFSKAFELALLGEADKSPWGDADGIIELDELARFVHIVTYAWSRATTGGRHSQHPVIWKIGSGRIPIDEIPPNIRLIRAPTRTFDTDSTWLSKWFSGGSSDQTKLTQKQQPLTNENSEPAAKATATANTPTASPDSEAKDELDKPLPEKSQANTTQPKNKKSDSQQNNSASSSQDDKSQVEESPLQDTTPQEGGMQPESPQKPNKKSSTKQDSTDSPKSSDPKSKKPRVNTVVDIWQLLENIGRHPQRNSTLKIGLKDYAPHVLNGASHYIALAELTELEGGKRSDEARSFLKSLTKSLQEIDAKKSLGNDMSSQSSTVAIIDEAIKSGMASQVQEPWLNLPEKVGQLLQARNDAIFSTNDAIELNGRLSGGNLPSTVDEQVIRNCLDEVTAATHLINTYSNQQTNDRRLMSLLDSQTQLLLHKNGSLREFIDTTTTTLLGGTPDEPTTAYHELTRILGSPAITQSTRSRLKKQYLLGTRKKPALTTDALTPASHAAIRTKRLLTESDLLQIGRLVNLQLNFFSVALGFSAKDNAPEMILQLGKDIQEAQTKLEDLSKVSTSQENDKLIDKVLGLGRVTAKIFQKLKSLSTSREFSDPQDRIKNDCLAGALRSLDWRDAFAANSEVILPPPNLHLLESLPLTLEIANNTFDEDRISINATYEGPSKEIFEDQVSFSFDPAVFQLSRLSGDLIGRNIKFSASELGWRGNQARFEVKRLATSTLFTKDQSAKIQMTLHAGTKNTCAEIVLPLLNSRDIVLAARGHPLTVVGPKDSNGWTHIAYKANKPIDSTGIGRASTAPTLTLRPWPSGTTEWELGIENLSDIKKQVTVQVFSAQNDLIKTTALETFQALAAAINQKENSLKPILVAKNITLQTDTGVTRVKLAPPAEKSDQENESGEKQNEPEKDLSEPETKGALPSPDAPEKQKKDIQVGSELAVVVEDYTQIGTTNKIVFRIHLTPIHPRHFVDSNAVYDASRREIRVLLRPLSPAVEAFPPAGLVASLKPLLAPSRNQSQIKTMPSVVSRKPDIRIQKSTLSDFAIATWTGPDHGQAYFALDINDYPRALIYSLECSPTTDKVAQYPQYDWRSIRIKQPETLRTLVRSPTAVIPFSLEVDAPADTFQTARGDSGSIDIVFRPISVGSASRAGEQIAWSGRNDRQITFKMPKKLKQLSVTTEVSDWKVEASGKGFSNVDVTAIARVSFAGRQTSATDSRTIVFDGTAPQIDSPPSASVIVGRELKIPIRVADDVSDGFFIAPDRVRPGVSGLANVEWAVDIKGLGKPEKWEPAVWLGDVRYEINLKTEKLSPGVRLPLLIRAVDKVGLSSPPNRVWLDIAAKPASPNNDIIGRVTLDGKGEPDVSVSLTGPAGERTVKTGKKGEFQFTNLEPGEYSVSARGAVRNTTRRSDLMKITLPASPAPPATIALKMQ